MALQSQKYQNKTLKFYNIAKCVFVGKSLVKSLEQVSGQNPIEPARLGCKIFHGPNVSNFEEVYKGCSQLKDIDKYLLKFSLLRVGLRKTDKGWGDAIYAKNDIFIAKLYYLFLPIIRLIKFPITIYRFFIRKFKRR